METKETSISSLVSLRETLRKQKSGLRKAQDAIDFNLQELDKVLVTELLLIKDWPTEDTDYIKAEAVLDGTYVNS